MTDFIKRIPLEDVPAMYRLGYCVCDACNTDLSGEQMVNMLMLGKNRCWGTLCESCRKRYWSKLPIR